MLTPEDLERLDYIEDSIEQLCTATDRDTDWLTSTVRAQAERIEALGAWQCAVCGCRFDVLPSPDIDRAKLLLEGVTYCSSCAKVESQQGTIGELRARVERLARVLAAEQGREGLEGWEWYDGQWWKHRGAETHAVELNPCPTSDDGEIIDWLPVSWSLVYHLDDDDGSSHREEIGTYATALEAMEAAEAALAGGSQ